MNLKKLIDLANSLADDLIPDEEVKEFVNDAIAAINIEVGANFPSLENMDDEPVFPEKWQRMLIVPYAKARIKEKDSSQFEWAVAYEQFFENLLLFKTNYHIPDEYKDENSQGTISERSLVENRPFIWGGW